MHTLFHRNLICYQTMNNQIFKKAILPHLIAVLVLLAANVAFFYPQIQGKVFRQQDIVSWNTSAQETMEYNKTHSTPLLWTNAMFGGMPTYQISFVPVGKYADYLNNILYLGFSVPIGTFLAMSLAYYIMLVLMGTPVYVAIIGALAFSFSTNNFILFEAGHNAKIASVAFIPLILAGLYSMYYKKWYLPGAALFGLALAANIGANHVQMTYYFALTLIPLGIAWLVDAFAAQKWKPMLMTTGLAIVLAVASLGANLSLLWPTYEYSQETMRGKPILSVTPSDASGVNSSSTVEGLDFDYAMQWSNGVKDLMASFIPRVVGGATTERMSSGATFQAVKYSNPDNQMKVMSLPMYWGDLTSTSGPAYFGIVITFLFLFASLLVKGSVKWWAVGAVVLTALLSLGKNLPGFQHLFFDYFPLYNKFRTPNSILTITALFMPLLAMLGVSQLIRRQFAAAELNRALAITAGVFLTFCLFLLAQGTSLFTFTGGADASMQPELVTLLIQDRKELFKDDVLRSFFYVLLVSLALWAFIRNKMGGYVLVAVLGILIMSDLWSVGRRYLQPDQFISQQSYQTEFEPRPADTEILNLEKSRGDYRVADLSEGLTSSSVASYYHNNIGGYHAAKLQRYQDILDFHLVKNHAGVINMLNTKHFISQQGQVQTNPDANGPVWFVDSILIVKTPDEEILSLDTLDTKAIAVVLDQEFDGYVQGFQPKKEGTIKLSSYDPQHLVYESESPSEQLAVFSEIWYGPGKGWRVLVDGKEQPLVRANYVLRATRVPAGKHKIEMLFEPRSVIVSGKVSTASSLLIWAFFLGIVGFQAWNWSKNPVFPEPLPPIPMGEPEIPGPVNTRAAAQRKKKK